MNRPINPSGVRVNKRNYVHVESTTVRDGRISYRALGLLTYLLDQREDWQVRAEQLSKGEGREGRDSIRRTQHELAAHGYYRLERRRFRTGKCAMGTAVSEYPVQQWADDYLAFGKKLDIPVIEQADGTFLVKYKDGTLGADGFAVDPVEEPPVDEEETPAPAEEAEPEPDAQPEPSAKPVLKTTAAKPAASAAPRKSTADKKAEAVEKAEDKKALDAAAEKVAAWWWEHAERHLGAYVGDAKGYIAMRGQIRNALAKGYSSKDCALALQHARKHWPARQQWQDALGVVTKGIKPQLSSGRVPYSDAATWGPSDEAPSSATSGTDDESDDATFGIIA